jgi:hypothetical protein
MDPTDIQKQIFLNTERLCDMLWKYKAFNGLTELIIEIRANNAQYADYPDMDRFVKEIELWEKYNNNYITLYNICKPYMQYEEFCKIMNIVIPSLCLKI